MRRATRGEQDEQRDDEAEAHHGGSLHAPAREMIYRAALRGQNTAPTESAAVAPVCIEVVVVSTPAIPAVAVSPKLPTT